MEQPTVDVKSQETGEIAEITDSDSKEEIENDDEKRSISRGRRKLTSPKGK